MSPSLSMEPSSHEETQTPVGPSKPSGNAAVNGALANAGAVVLRGAGHEPSSAWTQTIAPPGQAAVAAAERSSTEPPLKNRWSHYP